MYVLVFYVIAAVILVTLVLTVWVALVLKVSGLLLQLVLHGLGLSRFDHCMAQQASLRFWQQQPGNLRHMQTMQ
jgi:hypothetical protein